MGHPHPCTLELVLQRILKGPGDLVSKAVSKLIFKITALRGRRALIISLLMKSPEPLRKPGRQQAWHFTKSHAPEDQLPS